MGVENTNRNITCTEMKYFLSAYRFSILSSSSEGVLAKFSSNVPGTDLYVEDIDTHSTCMIGDNESNSNDNSLEAEDDDCNDDCDDPITMFAWNDPHLKHLSKGVNGNAEYIMNCLDCRVEKAINEVQEEMKESLAVYCKSNGTILGINPSKDKSNLEEDKFNQVHIPDGTLTPRQKRRRRRKYCKAAKKEDRKKRRKVIEDLSELSSL